MDNLALRIDHVSKEYRLGVIGGATLKGELQSKLARMRHKEDPNLKIGEVRHDPNERFLAINDMSFEVKKGETIGIIGQNGAGKSTILKMICRVTTPTKGKIFINGRITSMLEVGTGFHPELTGRENVYLNGAILGMSKEEIDKKFDEIVEFSEIGQFIDTPVKRYSSGMKVKLAFSVASHLDSEIMIMDEVLAVGDVNFQNKCIERMKKVAAEENRTILYVSHNMSTVRRLCTRCIVLSHGQVIFDGSTDEAIALYAKEHIREETFFDVRGHQMDWKCKGRHIIESFELLDTKTNIFDQGSVIRFRLRWNSENNNERIQIKAVVNANGIDSVGVTYGGELSQVYGENSTIYSFDTGCLIPGRYSLYFFLYDNDNDGNVVYYDQCEGISFKLLHCDTTTHLRHWYPDWGHAVLPCLSMNAEE